MGTTTIQITLKAETCCTCGMVFGLSEQIYTRRRSDHDRFYCPAGHPQYYSAESDKERAEKAAKRAQELLDQSRRDHDVTKRVLEATNSTLSKKDKQIKRLEKRAKGGACPCCNRTFTSLARHMKSKHPDFATETM